MRRVAYVFGGLAAAGAGTYLVVYLYRWQWQRAMLCGVLLLVVEVMLLGIVMLGRLSRIEERLRTEKRLSEDEISTEVDDNSVVLKGSVANIDQHDLAVRIAQRYAGNREIVDRLELKQRT